MAKSRATIPKEVFISYSSGDRKFAIKLTESLNYHGIASWFSEKHILGAQQWHDEIGKALKRCDWFVLILTPAAIQSGWVKRELLFALDQKRLQERVIPVIFKKCDPAKLSWTLPSYQWIDFTESYHNGCRDLLRIWGIRYQVH
jgi:hypothetical protein